MINVIQNSINYIEENLTENITFESVAKEIGMSSFYFHRIFSSLVGISPTTYIRNRRLTCAAEELTKGNGNIIDIALKYGFDSHESFSRAFKNFHGVVPKLAKKYGNELKSYSIANLNYTLDNQNILNYRIEKKSKILINAVVRKFDIENKDNIPKFWNELKQNNLLQTMSNNYNSNLLGICIGTQNDFEYKYGIGVEIDSPDLIYEGCQYIEIPESTWVVFKCEGQNPDTINKLWTRIYREFFVTSNYKQSMDIDFELYDNSNTEIWIPVAKNEI